MSAEQTTRPGGGIRVPFIDAARGLAVILMVIYHFSWDLSHFDVIEIDVVNDRAWQVFAAVIAAGFLLLVGISQEHSLRGGFHRRSFLKRLMIIAGAAALVSIGSYVAFPNSFIFFGILHAIAAFSVIALLFQRLAWWALFLAGLVVLVLPFVYRADVFNSPGLIWLGLFTVPPRSNDFVGFFPWFSWVLFGIGLGKLHLAWLEVPRPLPGTWWLQWLGRWSLVIYLVHQPLLFAAFTGLDNLGWLPKTDQGVAYVNYCARNCEAQNNTRNFCVTACQCLADRLQAESFWPRVLSDSLTEDETLRTNELARACASNP